MRPELRRALTSIGTLNNLNDHEMENMAAMLLLVHYNHSIPEFEMKEEYLGELEKKGKLKLAIFKRKKQMRKAAIKRFMDDNIMVR